MKKFLIFVTLAIALIVAFRAYKKRSELALFFKIHSEKPAWAKEQLEADFFPFRAKGISQKALDETFQKVVPRFSYRYRIVKDEIYRMGPEVPQEKYLADRIKTFEEILRRLRRSADLPNVDFLVCFMDGVPEDYVEKDFYMTEHQAPLLTWAKKQWAPFLVLIPDFLTTTESSWEKDVNAVNREFCSIPWEERLPAAFWRGVASDKGYTLDNYTQKPRYLLSLLSQQFPEKINAAFSRAHGDFTTLFTQKGLIKGHAPIPDHLKYKYLPVLDGWMCTFPGYQWRLLSGSVPFKQESDEIQYFYRALTPYVHYLPVKNDMSDLLNQIDWAEKHDAECKEIGQNARKFALENLMPAPIYAYFYWVLQTYQTHQTFDLKNSFTLDSNWIHIES